MNRRTARNHAFRLVFQLSFHELEELDNLIQYYLESIEKDEELDEKNKSFIIEETKSTAGCLNELDSYIAKYSQGWDISRVFKADLAIMRLAAYELLYRADIPASVSISEAVLLAKEYGSDNSSSFINGILGKIAKEVRG